MTSNNATNIQNQIQKVINSEIWVIKVGTAILTNQDNSVDKNIINSWAKQIQQLMLSGKKVILVSSGAIAAGMQKLGWENKPTELAKKQAAASVGQVVLANVYQQVFEKYNIQTSQILLTHDDAADRKRYLNIRGTINSLLENNILPIVNENDTVSFEEIRFGDNDNLGALVANLVNAGLYIILTDQNGIYNKDPRSNNNAKLIKFDYPENNELDSYIGSSKSKLGSGGMLTKIQAARKALNSGTTTIITHGKKENCILNIANNSFVGTVLYAKNCITSRKQWLGSLLQTKGSLVIDNGATKALCNDNKSLLAVGIISVKGDFLRGEIVSIFNDKKIEIAKGICNYSSSEVKMLKGVLSKDISKILGYTLEKDIIHRDNLILTNLA